MATLTTSYQKLGTISTSKYSQLRIYGKYNSQSTIINGTNLSIQLRLYGNGGSGSFSSGSCGISGIYNGDSSSYSTSLGSTSYSKGSEKTLATYTYNVKHRDDGTYSDTITYKISSNGSVSGSGSVTFSLPTIARASQPSVNPTSVDIGGTTTISTNRASSSFTHTISYTFGSLTGTIATGVGASIDWTIPDTFYSQFSSTEKSKTCTITCITYSGNTNIGSKTTTLTINIPSSSSPTYSNVSKVETDADVINALGTTMATAVLNLSKPRYQMTLASQNGAALTSAVIKCGDLTNTIDLSGALYNLDYTFQNAMASNVVTITITDSRGMTTTYTDTYSSYETYTPITLTRQLVERTGLSGTTRATFEGTMQPDNINGVTGNGIYASYRYKETGGDWSNLYDFNVTYDDNTNRTKWYIDENLVLTALYNKSYTIELQVTDANISTPLVYTYTINKAVPTMSLGENDMQVNGDLFVADEDGNNPRNVLDEMGDLSTLTTTDQSSLVNAINEIDSNNIEEMYNVGNLGDGYIKFKNGLMYEWKFLNVKTTSHVYGPLWYSDHSLGNWAVPFSNFLFFGSSVNNWNYWSTLNGMDNTSAGTIRLYRANSSSGNSIYIVVWAFGKWK